jgi:hypothetical protein
MTPDISPMFVIFTDSVGPATQDLRGEKSSHYERLSGMTFPVNAPFVLARTI